MLAPLKPNVISLQKQHIRGYGIRFFILTGLQTDFLCKFAAIKNDTHTMFENLNERLERSFKILKGEGRITEINVAETLKDVRRALLDADVNYKVAKSFTDTVKQKALGQNVLTSVKPGQLMVKIVHDELAALMGGEASEIQFKSHPSVILWLV